MGRRDADKPVSPFGHQAVTTLAADTRVKPSVVCRDYGRGAEGSSIRIYQTGTRVVPVQAYPPAKNKTHRCRKTGADAL
jgi:hypothetical protein